MSTSLDVSACWTVLEDPWRGWREGLAWAFLAGCLVFAIPWEDPSGMLIEGQDGRPIVVIAKDGGA